MQNKTRYILPIIVVGCILVLGGAFFLITNQEKEAVKLPTITVELHDNVVTWTPVDHAEQQEISINGHLSYIEASISSYTLTDGQTFKIRAIGDGTTYLSGDWSNAVTYTAPIITVSFSVTFLGMNDQVLKTETVEQGKGAEAPTPPTMMGYRFDGWDKDFTNVQSDLVVNACYIQQIEVLFLNYDGTEIAGYTLDKGQGITSLPQNPTRNGYRFMGWTVEDFSAFHEDCEIKAVWAATFTVRFLGLNDKLIRTIEVLSGESATAPSPEEVLEAGYTFKEWIGTFNHVTSDVTVYASYIKNKYTVKFLIESGALVGEIEAEYGDTISTPTLPQSIFIDEANKVAYRITGWKNLPALVTDNHEIKAYATPISEPVLYYQNGIVRLLYTGDIYGISFQAQITSDTPLTPSPNIEGCSFAQSNQIISAYYSSGTPLHISGALAVMSFSGGVPTDFYFTNEAEAFLVVEQRGALQKIQPVVIVVNE